MIRKFGDRVAFSVNGQSLEAPEGQPLVEVLNDTGIDIQHVCYHEALGPIKTCDTCLVNVNGKLARSCDTRVSAGLNVTTDAPVSVQRAHRGDEPHSLQPQPLLHHLRQQQR